MTLGVPHHTYHWLAVSDTHIAFDEAVASDETVTIEGWLNEWDACNKDEDRPEKRYQLYTVLRERPRLVCVPDAAFLLSRNGQSKVYYLEQDRATSGSRQVANSKTPGYAEMAERMLHRRHFSTASLDQFSVLMVTPNAKRRDLLRRSIQGKAGWELWRFVSAEDLQAANLLYEPIYFTCDGGPWPLLRRA